MKELLPYLEEAKRIIVTISDYGRSIYYNSKFPYFNLYVELPDRPYPIKIEAEDHSYWSKRKKAYAMNVYGSDRVYELIYPFIYISKDKNLHTKTIFL